MSPPILYYVRHGLTDWNAQGRLQGRRDIPINAEGRAQASHCAEVLRGLFARAGRQPDAYGYASSPLGRACQTMEIIRAALGLAPAGYAIDERLAEIAFGRWEGLTYRDILARDADIIAEREGNKWGFRPPGGETYAEVAKRVGAWYETLQRDTVVTAHGGTARALIAALGIKPPETAVHEPIAQGVVYVYADRVITRHA
jgi:broad specificity phosphatase PhoE